MGNYKTPNLSFKAGGLTVLVAKAGHSGVKGYKRVKYIEELQTLLSKKGLPNFMYRDDLIKAVAALCKTPDSFYDHAHDGIVKLADFITLFSL